MAGSDKFNTPNLSVPLAYSYNPRYVDGYAQTVTNASDQRKVNCYYDVVDNPVTGKRTIYLVKRPGTVRDSVGNTSAETPYLVSRPPVGNTFDPWVFTLNVSTIKVHQTNNASSVIFSQASHWPIYVDRTLVGGRSTVVLQIGSNDTAINRHRVFYASTVATWSEISTGATFTSLAHTGKMEHIGGYALQMASDNYIYNSTLNTISTWAATSRIQKQITQDDAAGLARLGEILLAFGQNTVEGFYNAGQASGSPLGRITQLAQRIGLGLFSSGQSTQGDRNYYATIGKRLYFIAGTSNSTVTGRSVYMFDGSRFEKVSTSFIDKLLALASELVVNYIVPFPFYGREAVALSLTDPGDTTQRWLMFFPSHNEWFEWTSGVFQPMNDSEWFIGCGTSSYAATIQTYNQSQTWQDDDNSIPVGYSMIAQFRLPKGDNARQEMKWCGVVADTVSSSPSQLNVEFSDNDYSTFSAIRNIDISQRVKQIYRCGAYKDRIVRLTHSSNAEFRAERFIARIE